MSAIGGPVESGLSARLRGNLHAAIQEELGDAGSAICTSPNEPHFHLRSSRLRFGRFVSPEKPLHRLKPSGSRRAFEIKASSPLREKLGGRTPAVVQRRQQRIPSSRMTVDACAGVEQPF